MSTVQALVTVVIIAAATFATRALPFLLFPGDRPTPGYIVYLGKVLPCATMGMLVIYCLKDVRPLAWPYGLPELLGIAAVVLLQYRSRSSLLSIAAGSALYITLVQTVFS